MSEYEALVQALEQITNVQFVEFEWKTRPNGDHGTYQLDFEVESDDGDDLKQDRAWEGSVDLFTHGKAMMTAAAVESALASVCGNSWHLNSEQYERETGLVHREFVFQVAGV